MNIYISYVNEKRRLHIETYTRRDTFEVTTFKICLMKCTQVFITIHNSDICILNVIKHKLLSESKHKYVTSFSLKVRNLLLTFYKTTCLESYFEKIKLFTNVMIF